MAEARAQGTVEILLDAEKAARNLLELDRKFQEATRRMEAATQRVDFDETTVEAQELRREVDEVARRFVRQGSRMEQALEKVGLETGQLRRKMNGVNDAAKEFGRQGSKVTNSLGNLRAAHVAAAAAVAAVVAKLQQVAAAAGKAALQYDRLERSFHGITGSAEEGAREFEFVREEAQRLGIEVVTLSDSWKAFLASTQELLTLEESRKLFIQVTEAVKATGGSTDDARAAMRALAQVASKGTVTAEELRQQLGDRLPRAFQLAASTIQKEGESIDSATRRLNKMLEQGELLSREFLPKFGDAIEAAFGGKLEPALESAESRINRFKNAFAEISGELLVEGIVEALDSIQMLGEELQQFAEIATGGRLEIESLASSIAFFVDWIGEASKSLIGLSEIIVGRFTNNMALVKEGFDNLTTGFMSFGTAAERLNERIEAMALSQAKAAESAEMAAVSLAKETIEARALGVQMLRTSDRTAEGVGKILDRLRNLAATFKNKGQEVPAHIEPLIEVLAKVQKELEETEKAAEKAAEKLDKDVAKAYENLTESSESLIGETEALEKAFLKLVSDGTAVTKEEMDKFADTVKGLAERFKEAGVESTPLLEKLLGLAEGYGTQTEATEDNTEATKDNTAKKKLAEQQEEQFRAAMQRRLEVMREINEEAQTELEALERKAAKLRETAAAGDQPFGNLADMNRASDARAELFELEFKLADARKDAARTARDYEEAQKSANRTLEDAIRHTEELYGVQLDATGSAIGGAEEARKAAEAAGEGFRDAGEGAKEMGEGAKKGAEDLKELTEESGNAGENAEKAVNALKQANDNEWPRFIEFARAANNELEKMKRCLGAMEGSLGG